jgi:DNA-nicking Smr family endonuclease
MAKKRKGGAHKGAHAATGGSAGNAGSGSAPPGSFSRSFADSLAEPEPEPVVLPRAPERLSSPFKNALGSLKKQLDERDKQQKLDKLKPPPPPSAVKPVARKKVELPEHEAMALSLAMQGVKPLGGGRPGRVGTTTKRVESRTSMVAPFGRTAEEEARSRLDALVAQDVSFRIERDHEWVRAARTDAPPRVVRELARRTRASETLDLHGLNQREARAAVISFLRSSHKRGLTVLCLVHGKGHNSEDGVGVLRDVAISAITDSGASQLVYAFCSAPDALGGTGALLVELKH